MVVLWWFEGGGGFGGGFDDGLEFSRLLHIGHFGF